MLRFLGKKDLENRGIHYCDVHLRRLESAGKFPKRVKIGDNRVGWVEEEIDAHQAARIAARSAVG